MSEPPDAIAPNGMVSSAHYLASQAGVWMLRQGGNAVDAAVCAAATIAVVAPHLNGVGGDLFAQVWIPGEDRPIGLNASGRSGSSATIENLQSMGHAAMPTRGPLTVTVPGAVSGWSALLSRFGTRRLYDVLEPAISYAEHGAPVTPKIAGAILGSAEFIQLDPAFASVFLPTGNPLETGSLFRNSDLANSLRIIGATDGEAMYRGELADRIVQDLEQRGGLLTRNDFADHQAEWVEPLETTFQGRTVFELPPNTQGVTALEMLNLVEELRLGERGWNTAGYLNGMMAAMEIAYEDRDSFVSDPSFTGTGAAYDLANKGHAAERLRARHGASAFGDQGDTVYLCAIDRNRMAVSLIQSQYMGFGSGVMAAKTGVHLQNRGCYFSLEPHHVNRLEPRKRTMHTLIPAVAAKDGNAELVFGSMGGDGQPQFQLQVLMNHWVFQMGLQEAIAAPRFVFSSNSGRRLLRIESGILESLGSQEVTAELEAISPLNSAVGHAQAIKIDSGGEMLVGAADPRGDGAALGY